MKKSLQNAVRRLKSTPVVVALGVLGALLILVLPVVLVSILARAEAEREYQARLAELEATGFPVGWEAVADLYGQVPSDENAALVYQEAHRQIETPQELTDTLPPWGNQDWPEPGDPFPEEWTPLAEELMDKNARGIELLHQAATVPAARFPIDFSEGLGTLIPHVSELRNSARLLSFTVVWHAKDGHWQEATEDLKALFALADALRDEPSLISQLTAVAIRGIGLNALEQALGYSSPPPDLLNSLQELIEHQISEVSVFEVALTGELAMVLSSLDALGSDWAFREDFGLSRMSGTPWRIWSYWYAGGLARDKTLYVNLTVRNIEAARAPLPERLALVVTDDDLEQSFARYKLPTDNITAILIPTVSRLFESEARMLSRTQCAIIALAAERYRYDHGALPASLEALAPEYLNELSPDPLTGEPIEYRTDESWRIVTSPAIITDRLGPPRFQLPAER
jgi:hypothetical protein